MGNKMNPQMAQMTQMMPPKAQALQCLGAANSDQHLRNLRHLRIPFRSSSVFIHVHPWIQSNVWNLIA